MTSVGDRPIVNTFPGIGEFFCWDSYNGGWVAHAVDVDTAEVFEHSDSKMDAYQADADLRRRSNFVNCARAILKV